MALYAEGRLSAAALEVYRICAARDGDDPRALLAERGVVDALEPSATTAAETIPALIEAADSYLATRSGPGIGEVRAAIAAARGAAFAQTAARGHPVATAHLGPALAALRMTHPALAFAIEQAGPHLDWVAYDAYPVDEIGADFAGGHAFASLIGGGAPVPAEDFDFGLFLVAPHLLYRDRCHASPELYAPLTGPHGWRFGPDAPLAIWPAHRPVWNEPNRPHLTKIGPVPFLSLFAWTRDVNEPARVVTASDWPALEALRLAG